MSSVDSEHFSMILQMDSETLAGRQRPLDMAGAVAGQHAAGTPGHCLTAGGRLPLAMSGAVPW